ncbi:MAG: hypothetical protein ABIL39_10605 [candidate division WOR-3 bacterium]
MRKFFIILTVFIYYIAYGQSNILIEENANLIDQAKNYYQNKEYTIVIKTLESILPQIDELNKIEAHKYLGFSYAKINDRISAKEHLKTLLKLNPQFSFKAQEVDSSIIEILNEAKREIAHEAAMCSCFIPGVGQVLKGEERKGKLLMLGSSLSFVSTVILWLETENRQQRYLGLGPDSVEYMDEYYSEYNKWFRISVSSSAIFIGFYLFSIWDAYFSNTQVKIVNETGSSNFIRGNDLIKIGHEFSF